MTGLTALWLPILLSAVIVFIISSIIHMATPWHKGDYNRLPDEDAVMTALRPFNIPPGDYMMPRPASMEDMKSAAFKEKHIRGPVAMITVMPGGGFGMGSQMFQWFVYLIVVGIFAGYIGGRALAPGTDYLHVFRFVGASAFLAYSAALWPFSIWYRRSWTTTIKATLDGLLFAFLTAGTFGWLWPKA
jgi:hypothetical protein